MKPYVTLMIASALLSVPTYPASATQLGEKDLVIYQSTLAVCRDATAASALRLGFNLPAAFTSLLTRSALQTRSSEGFWQALEVCYGYRYGVLNYGQLMKQLIDLGHFTSETATTLAYAAAATVSWRTAIVGFMSLQLNQSVQLLRQTYFPIPTDEEKQQLKSLTVDIFREPNQAVDNVITQAKSAIARINGELQSSSLPDLERSRLILKRDEITRSLKALLAARGLNE